MTDELKPVPCGCGGEAKVEWANGYDPFAEKRIPKLWYGVICKKCKIQTKSYYTEAEAIQAWNRAMGERTAKVECIDEVYRDEIVDHYLSGICGICGESTYDRAKYCLNCGAKLEWEHE